MWPRPPCWAWSILIALGRLALRLRQRRFGSRLLLKLAGIFGLVGLLPGVLIYTVSYQFVSRSIETWFDVRVEGALEAGLNLGRNTLDSLTQDLAKKTQVAADRLGSSPDALPGLLELERLREQLGARNRQPGQRGRPGGMERRRIGRRPSVDRSRGHLLATGCAPERGHGPGGRPR